MLWLVEVLVALIALIILALTGMLGKTAKRHSRKISRKIRAGVKKRTKERWVARRNESRGVKPKKKRTPNVLKSHPIVQFEGRQSKTEQTDYIPCNAETTDGLWCTRNRVKLMDGTRLDHCWQHPGKRKSNRRPNHLQSLPESKKPVKQIERGK